MTQKRADGRAWHGRWLLFPGIAIALLLIAIVSFVAYQESQGSIELDERTLHEIMFDLVTNHPRKEIREDLHQAFLTFEVFFSADTSLTGTGNAGIFALVSPEKITQGGGGRTTDLLPVLIFNEGFIFALEVPDVIQQGLILHEYEHYLHWKTGTFPQEMFLLARAGGSDTTPEEATIFYKGEVRAYHKECLFLIEQGEGDQRSYCIDLNLGDELEFRRGIASLLAEKWDRPEFLDLMMKLAESQ